LAMDVQPRASEYGARRHHACHEVGDGRLAPLLATAKSGGITHVLDAWHYLGTVTTLTAARKLKGEPLGFDRDSYRIIRAAIESGLDAITVLGP
ncbi:hypothetical protein WGE86_21730, partial [Xanthomonas euvesicatoria pv. euvesicatoria]